MSTIDLDALCDELPHVPRTAIRMYVDNMFVTDDDDLPELIEEAYAGAWDSGEAFAEELITDSDDLSGVPELLRYRIDWAGIWRDLEMGGDYWSARDPDTYELHVFRNL